MRRNLKGFFVVIGLSLISAITLRYMLGRVERSLAPPPDIPGVTTPLVSVAEIERRFVGCGRFNFVFDARGYSSRQWPEELVPDGPLFRTDAYFVARGGDVRPVADDTLGRAIGRYEFADREVRLTLGPDDAPHFEAVLEARGDSLAGPLREVRPPGDGIRTLEIGRLFLQAAIPRPAGCDAGPDSVTRPGAIPLQK